MANLRQLEKLKEGVAAWNDWRRENPEIPDLSNADLSDARLPGINLREANLRSANLRNACLTSANFYDLVLCHADLSGANLTNADLRGLSCSRQQWNLRHSLGVVSMESPPGT